jgi:prepilin-type N-terminal cleavage/methylation domain-containing protein
MDVENKSRGFSLIEVMISLLVLLVVAGAAFYALAYYQRNYGSFRVRAVMHEGMRGAVELLSQEVGQAGLLDFQTETTGASAITAALGDQSVVLMSVNSIFQNQILIVGSADTEETVVVDSVDIATSTIQAKFAKNHPGNSIVRAYGVFPQGILPPPQSDANNLKIFGDINNDGNISYVQYICDTTAGTLSRAVTPVTPDPSLAKNTTYNVLVNNLIPTPGVACFQYATPVSLGTYTFVPSVAVTLSVQSSKVDPQTKQYVTMRKSFLNLAPRNVLMGLELAQNGYRIRLQPTPTNITSF